MYVLAISFSLLLKSLARFFALYTCNFTRVTFFQGKPRFILLWAIHI